MGAPHSLPGVRYFENFYQMKLSHDFICITTEAECFFNMLIGYFLTLEENNQVLL